MKTYKEWLEIVQEAIDEELMEQRVLGDEDFNVEEEYQRRYQLYILSESYT